MRWLVSGLEERPHIEQDVLRWQRSLFGDHRMPLAQAGTDVAVAVLDTLDQCARVRALPGAAAMESLLHNACCRLAATAAEGLGVVIAFGAGSEARPPLGLQLHAALEVEVTELVDQWVDDCAMRELVDVVSYERLLRHTAREAVRGLGLLALEPVVLEHDPSNFHGRDLLELYAVALAPPVAFKSVGHVQAPRPPAGDTC